MLGEAAFPSGPRTALRALQWSVRHKCFRRRLLGACLYQASAPAVQSQTTQNQGPRSAVVDALRAGQGAAAAQNRGSPQKEFSLHWESVLSSGTRRRFAGYNSQCQHRTVLSKGRNIPVPRSPCCCRPHPAGTGGHCHTAGPRMGEGSPRGGENTGAADERFCHLKQTHTEVLRMLEL